MPELPEAQVLADELRQRIVGKRIVAVEVRQPKALNLPVEEFKRRATGLVRDVRRRAKSVVIQLEGDGGLWLHMGLRSEVGWKPASACPPTAFLRLDFDDGQAFYMDKTFMGKAHLVDGPELDRRWDELGAEPLDADFTPDRFRRILGTKPNAAVKALLMEQEQIAGIGNVYSDEILFVAGIRPDRKVSSLDEGEIERLYAAIRKVLGEAIEKGGGPEWVTLDGRPGGYVPRVHGTKNCPEGCGGKVLKITFGGRTAYHCDKRQH